MHPKVSVVIPIVHKDYYLYSAIESVLDQTIEDFEIIVDDASTGNVRKVVERFKDKRIRYIHHKEKREDPQLGTRG